MNKVIFDDMCRMFECEQYIEWDHDADMGGFQTTITCVSCQQVGQSYNIEEYPEDCPYKKELRKYAVKELAAMKRFKDMMDKKKVWRRLAKVN